MAGMFYSLSEAAAKLGISEEELVQRAKDGAIREFRDGESVMFKIDEVDALAAEGALRIDVADETSAAVPAPEDDILVADDELKLDDPDLDAIASEDDDPLGGDIDAVLGLDDVGEASGLTADGEETTGIDLPLAADTASPAQAEADILADEPQDEPQIDLGDTQLIADTPAAETGGASALIDDVLLADDDKASESADAAAGDANLSEDTALTGEGINVLGETDGDYKLTDDTMAETLAGLGATGEASLEEIEEDVNLDSFGSGSGLLDLSLQADDTSLGGILDEIYTSEDDEAPAPDTEQATAQDMPDPFTEGEDVPTAADMAMAPAPAPAAVELAPDASSQVIGSMLFLALALLVFTAIVAWSANMSDQLPAIAEMIAGINWMVMGGLIVVAMIWGGIGLAKGSDSGGGGGRAAKAKKGKRSKTKKEKPAKAPKEKKAKKPKKGLFGKKKK